MPWLARDDAALFTDLYELTMGASYLAHGMTHAATFDLYVRELPLSRRFLVVGGIEHAAEFLTELRVTGPQLDYLRSLGTLPEAFLDHLATLHFTGDLWAIPEGEVAFAREPIVRVTAPMIEAQLVETFLLNAVMFQTMIASKAARVGLACGDRSFVDFSARRDHGTDAALQVARASYIGGAAGTSLVVGGQLLGIPVVGTMAHSFVMAFDDERDAFRVFAGDHPATTLLIDTYDTEEGARRAVAIMKELAPGDVRIAGVRLDSGDLDALSRAVRKILDDGGLPDVRIFASGDLDEYQIATLVQAGAPVDAFGVGTQLGTSGDAPNLGGVYKLAEYHGPKMKLSRRKVTLPGRKQVFRVAEGTDGQHDVIALDDEEVAGGRPLLQPVIVAGRRVAAAEPLDDIRARCAASLARLPERLRRLDPVDPAGAAGAAGDVRPSPRLDALVAGLQQQVGR